MNKMGVNRVWQTFKDLPMPGKLIVFAACFIVGALLVAGSGMVSYRVTSYRYAKREAARMKQVQAALSAADAAEKRAEAKEAQAELLKQQNEAKAKVTTADKQKLEQEAKATDAKITNDYAADVQRINANQSDCDRCRDSCSRLDRLAVSNPALAELRCTADACADSCPTQ